MSSPFEIQPLRPFTQSDVWPLLTGYETRQIYQVEKIEEGDALTRFECRLVQLEQPLSDTFYCDFPPEEVQHWNDLIFQGYSFGAYQAGRWLGWRLAKSGRKDASPGCGSSMCIPAAAVWVLAGR